MRASLLLPMMTLLGLGVLPACTINYYVPAATDAPVAAPGPHRHPPRGQWQQVPGPPRPPQYPPVASTPQPAPQPGYPTPAPAPPVRQTPPPAPGPTRHGPVHDTPGGPPRTPPAPATPAPANPYPTGGVKPSKPVPTPVPSAPAPSVPAPTYPYPTGGVKPAKDVATSTGPAPTAFPVPVPPPAPVPDPAPGTPPAPAPTYPYPTGGIKPSKPVDEVAPTRPDDTLGGTTGPVGTQPVPVPSAPGGGKISVEAETQTGPVLIFGKTPCFGRCPQFTARFYANGRLQYEGQQYAPVEGNRDLMLDPSVVQRLLQAAESSHFRNFKPVYSNGAVDLPSTTLVITYPDGLVKSVRVDEGAPEELQKLFAFIDAQLVRALNASNDQ